MNFLSSRTGKALAALGLSAMLLTIPITSFARDRDDHDSDRGADRGYHNDYDRGSDRDRGGYYYYPDNDWDLNWGLDWGWGSGGPFWNDYPAYYYQNRTGKIKLEDVSKSDKVYIDGAFVGRADKLGTLRLRPGTYTLTIKNHGRDVYSQRVYVTRDRTLKLEVRDQSGKLKFQDAKRTDRVYLNGKYEGEVSDLGTLHLPPGSYNVTVTDHGKDVYNRQIYLPTKETLDLDIGDRG
jgi:hypothetical protein